MSTPQQSLCLSGSIVDRKFSTLWDDNQSEDVSTSDSVGVGVSKTKGYQLLCNQNGCFVACLLATVVVEPYNYTRLVDAGSMNYKIIVMTG